MVRGVLITAVYNLHRPFRSQWFVGFLVANMQITYGVLSATHTTAALDGGSGIGRGHCTGDRHSTCLIRRSLWTSGVTVCGCSTLGESELRGPGQRFAVAARASMATVHQVVVSTMGRPAAECSCQRLTVAARASMAREDPRRPMAGWINQGPGVSFARLVAMLDFS